MSTGLEIFIEKIAEDERSVEYRYLVRPGRGGFYLAAPTGAPGRARLLKSTGEVLEVEPCPDDRKQLLFGKAGYTIRKHWREGSFPAVTWYAS